MGRKSPENQEVYDALMKAKDIEEFIKVTEQYPHARITLSMIGREIQKKLAPQLVKDKKSVSEIAKEFRKCKNTVYSFLKKSSSANKIVHIMPYFELFSYLLCDKYEDFFLWV